MLERMNHDQRKVSMVTIWSLWKARNEMLWEEKDTSPAQVVGRSEALVHEWTFYNSREIDLRPSLATGAGSNASSITWRKPHHGFIIVNVCR